MRKTQREREREMDSLFEDKSGSPSPPMPTRTAHKQLMEAKTGDQAASMPLRGTPFSIDYILSHNQQSQAQTSDSSQQLIIEQLNLMHQQQQHLLSSYQAAMASLELEKPAAHCPPSKQASQTNPNFLYLMTCMLLQQQQQQQKQQQQQMHQQQLRHKQLRQEQANIGQQNQPQLNPIDFLAQLTASASGHSTRETGRAGSEKASQLAPIWSRVVNEQHNWCVGQLEGPACGGSFGGPSLSEGAGQFGQQSASQRAMFGAPAEQHQRQLSASLEGRESKLGQCVARSAAKLAGHPKLQPRSLAQPEVPTTVAHNKQSSSSQSGGSSNAGGQSGGRPDKGDSLKPAHSYIGLIGMCILSTPEKRMVLNDIYQYILDHYPYYRNRGSGWRNSVRHNLSLNECFQKAGRAANGKGHYWTIHPANMDDFMNGDFRRRRAQRKVRRWNNMDVPSDESDDESTEDANRPPLPEHFKRALEMHQRLEAAGFRCAGPPLVAPPTPISVPLLLRECSPPGAPTRPAAGELLAAAARDNQRHAHEGARRQMMVAAIAAAAAASSSSSSHAAPDALPAHNHNQQQQQQQQHLQLQQLQHFQHQQRLLAEPSASGGQKATGNHTEGNPQLEQEEPMELSP